jgi:NADPH:quinone reductase-like Zn-dependent oxidoreductase
MPKAIRFNQLGGPEVLHIEDQPERKPGPGEVLLKVEAVASTGPKACTITASTWKR